jgi:hypothetical protein
MGKVPEFYIFGSDDPEMRGLSLERDGHNLPRLAGNSSWTPLAVAALTLENLQRHTLDPGLALLNLKTKGFHFARVRARMLPFPQAHRPPA